MATPTPFKAWYDSRRHLDDAIQRYIEHLQALETAIIHHEDNTLGRGALDELFAEVRQEQTSVSPRSEKLERARVALNRVHNRFTAFVPIRSLPGDVLVHIFALARDKCRFFPGSDRVPSRCQITKTILAVTHVCTDWRRLVVSTSPLWTHVDIIDNGPYADRQGELDTMWLERAGSAPLSVQVVIQHDVQSEYTKGALNQLVPHLGNVRSLGLYARSRHTLQAALAYWMSHGTPGSVQELHLTGYPELLQRSGVIFTAPLSLEPDVLNSFLVPILILRLTRVSMSFFSSVYCDLIYLKLSSIPSKACPTMLMLTHLLSASPGLRVLKLERLQMDSSQDIPHTELKLNDLERLDLVELFPDPCSTLLPMLNPGPGELSLRLGVPINSKNAKAVVAFLNRSNVTKLFTNMYPGALQALQAAKCFAAITDLHMLVIDFRGSFTDDCNTSFNALLPLPDPCTSSMCRWPNLRALWLIDGAPETNHIKEVVEAYHIRTVILSLLGPRLDRAARAELEPLVWNIVIEDTLPTRVVAAWDTRY